MDWIGLSGGVSQSQGGGPQLHGPLGVSQGFLQGSGVTEGAAEDRAQGRLYLEVREVGDGLQGGEGPVRRGAETLAEGVADGEKEVHVADTQRPGPLGGLYALNQGSHLDSPLCGIGEHRLTERLQIQVLSATYGI